MCYIMTISQIVLLLNLILVYSTFVSHLQGWGLILASALCLSSLHVLPVLQKFPPGSLICRLIGIFKLCVQ